jgi:putative modified peptide
MLDSLIESGILRAHPVPEEVGARALPAAKSFLPFARRIDMQIVSQESNTQVNARPSRRTAPIDPQVADRLLDLLSTDDAFRKLFSRDPATALTQVGFVKVAGETSPDGCFWGITQLASKAQIALAREEIRQMLTRGLAQTTPSLDAGLSGTRTRK